MDFDCNFDFDLHLDLNLNLDLGLDLDFLFPKLALAIGVITALYKGPWFLCGNVARAARKICL